MLVVAASASACKNEKADKRGSRAQPAVTERPCGSTFQQFRTRYRYDGSPATCDGPPEMLVVGCPSGDEISNPQLSTTTWRTFTYDRDHRLVSIDIREGHAKDGPITTRTTYQYSGGDLHAASIDRGNDGTTDTTVEYRRSGDQLVRVQDTGADGKPDLTDTQSFDANGRLTKIETHREGDAAFDSTTTFERNGDRLVAQQIDVSGTTLSTTFLYDCPP
jgi:hypothetical protein